MAISSWNAGIIRPVAVAPTGPFEDGAAPGVWTLDQVAYWTKQGLWPTAGNTLQRGLFGKQNDITYIAIQSTGNSTDFGDLQPNMSQNAGCASSTRGIFGTDNDTPTQIAYVTIATLGNSTVFGNISSGKLERVAALSNETRGIIAGGSDNIVGRLNVIQYITIATTGNTTDFGDLTIVLDDSTGCASTTRGIIGGGGSTSTTNVIQYVTIATTGDATDFGDLTLARYQPASCSSNTRGVFAGGFKGGVGYSNIIDYVTIATTGDATDFGDLTVARYGLAGCSSPTRGVFGGGTTGSNSNVMDYITIATTGNATDFGDLTLTAVDANSIVGACSNCHGGL